MNILLVSGFCYLVVNKPHALFHHDAENVRKAPGMKMAMETV